MTITSSSEQQQALERRSIDQSKIAYQKPQPAGMVPDVFVGSRWSLTATSTNGCRNRPQSGSGRSS